MGIADDRTQRACATALRFILYAAVVMIVFLIVTAGGLALSISFGFDPTGMAN